MSRLPVAVLLVACLFAASSDGSVVLAPGEGVTTNVYALFTGDTAVEVAGPGTVRLNSGNSHTGGTTLSGGTLIVSGDIPGGGHSPVGAGTFTVSGGTLRGSGTFGGDITGTGDFTIEAPNGFVLSGNNAFGGKITVAGGTLGIAGGTTAFSQHLYLQDSAAYSQTGGSVAMDANNVQLAYGNDAKSSFAMTGGTFDANGKNVVVGYSMTGASATIDISGDAVFQNAGNVYPYQNGNSLSLSVRDGGTFAAKRIYANASGSTAAISVTNRGVIGFTNINVSASGSATLLIDGGILRNDGAPSGADYYKWIQDSSTLSISVGPGGATFKDGGKTTKFAQIYKEMTADAGDGSAPKGVVFDGGNWAYYTAQSYDGPTVIKNGAALFLPNNGTIPSGSAVTIAAGSRLHIGNTDKSVSSLVLENDAIIGTGSNAKSLSVTGSVTLPSRAKIGFYNATTPTSSAKNTNGSYDVLKVPVAYADALRAVSWSCATASSSKSYDFSVTTSGDTATLTMTIDAVPSGSFAVSGDIAFGGTLAVDGDITIGNGATLSTPNIYGSSTGGSITINNGGTLDASGGNIRPVDKSGNSFHLYLNDGGALIMNQISGVSSGAAMNEAQATGMFHFNGGTIYPMCFEGTSDGLRYLLNYQTAYIGANGLTIDLTAWTRPADYLDWCRSTLQGNVNHDPNCVGTDGGITVRGVKGDRSCVCFGGRFAGSTLTGGIRAENGATVAATANALTGQTLTLAPGSRFRPYNNTSTLAVGNLTIGAAGGTDAVLFDGSDCQTNFNVVVSGALSILSPVEFTITGAWNNDSYVNSGVYTALVYQAASPAINTSLFRLPAGASGLLSAETVALTEGTYAGYTALVVTIENDIVVTGATEYPTPLTVSDDRSCGSIVVGGAWNGVADPVANTELTVSGNVTASDALYLGYNPAPGADKNDWHQGFLTLNGGSIATPAVYSVYRPCMTNSNDSECRFGCEATMNGGLLDVAGDVRLGFNRSKNGDNLYSRLTVNNGRVAVGGRFYLLYDNTPNAYTAPGSIVLNGGEVDVKGLIDLTRNASNPNNKAYTEKFGVWVNGGTLKAENIMMTATSAKTAKVYFNGGMYAPYGASAANRTMQNLNKCYVSTNGAIVSTENIPAGETYAIAQALLTDPSLNGATDGGLVKRGAGTLALSGANTFTGPVKVEGGTLVAASGNALSADVAVSDGAVLDLGGNDISFDSVAASGVIANGDVTVTDALRVADGLSCLAVDGDLTLTGNTVIDFGLSGNEAATGGWRAVAAVSGTLTAPKRLNIRNAGGEWACCETACLDGVLFVKPSLVAGTFLTIR